MPTTNATDLLVAGNIVGSTTTGPGSGFTQRLLTAPDGDIAEDRLTIALDERIQIGLGVAVVFQVKQRRACRWAAKHDQAGGAPPLDLPCHGNHAFGRPDIDRQPQQIRRESEDGLDIGGDIGMSQISQAMKNLNQVARQNLDATNQVKQAAQNLNSLGIHLNEMTAE